MSLYDKASIALIPSGTKASTLYSVLPANGNGDFTHDRNLTTATRVNKDGLIESVAEDVPRLDYPLTNGVVGDCPHLLLEPSRTNLAERTEVFNSSYWTKSNTSISPDEAASPDGSQTADKYILDCTSSRSQISRVIYTVGTQYTTSLFVKYDSVQYFYISNAGAAAYRVVFDIENGTIISTGSSVDSSKIENYGNGWYRCSATFTAAYTTLYYKLSPNSNNATFTNTTDFSYIWGAQIEEGSYPTSYIPWDGSGSTTRSADVCNGSGTSADFNDSEGVLFAELQALDDIPSVNGYVSLSDGTSVTNAVLIQYRNNGDLRLYNGGTVTANMIFRDAGATLTDNLKIAIKYGTSTSDYKVYINGVSKTIETAFVATSMSGLDSLQFAYSNGTSSPFEGKCKQLIVFNESLTDSELATLTS